MYQRGLTNNKQRSSKRRKLNDLIWLAFIKDITRCNLMFNDQKNRNIIQIFVLSFNHQGTLPLNIWIKLPEVQFFDHFHKFESFLSPTYNWKKERLQKGIKWTIVKLHFSVMFNVTMRGYDPFTIKKKVWDKKKLKRIQNKHKHSLSEVWSDILCENESFLMFLNDKQKQKILSLIPFWESNSNHSFFSVMFFDIF